MYLRLEQVFEDLWWNQGSNVASNQRVFGRVCGTILPARLSCHVATNFAVYVVASMTAFFLYLRKRRPTGAGNQSEKERINYQTIKDEGDVHIAARTDSTVLKPLPWWPGIIYPHKRPCPRGSHRRARLVPYVTTCTHI